MLLYVFRLLSLKNKSSFDKFLVVSFVTFAICLAITFKFFYSFVSTFATSVAIPSSVSNCFGSSDCTVSCSSLLSVGTSDSSVPSLSESVSFFSSCSSSF